MTPPTGWLLLWMLPHGPGARLGEIFPGTRRLGVGLWAVPVSAGSPEEILAACLAAGVRVCRSVVAAGAVEVRGPAA